ncbi:MAG: methylenetetrahydrofolate--tRNA-(uracil(54)-C(5))-methyltransferase (FADH(2)-oxidizing) TrmFO, partial [Nitrospirota bacterium]|nr:methylenetetrahydrofolate--tRNA-(uracil(54)-C(5))-methyltransferase (FADH(2)-oxidizing) TrmFO [Nitrospirota bacterium]
MSNITIIGGGLAGCEAAWQAAERGVEVRLFEMRPTTRTPAHNTDQLAELVCSNSLRSADTNNAVGLLKEEMRRLGSLVMQVADETRVPAGSALAVDRGLFSRRMTDLISDHPYIGLVREEVTAIPEDGITVVASGPLTSESLTKALRMFTREDYLYFYDAIAPIVDADSLDMSIVFRASRYGKGGDDYLNCPMSKEEYDRFYDALMAAEKVPVRAFEDERFFEGCMPVEVMAARGRDTLRFGPMKPVGLDDPRTGRWPHAVVQLRQE